MKAVAVRDPLATLSRPSRGREILSTQLTGAQLTVEVAPNETADFEASLKDEFPKVNSAIANIDMRQAEAYMPNDQMMIRSAVRAALPPSGRYTHGCVHTHPSPLPSNAVSLDARPPSTPSPPPKSVNRA